MIVAVALMVDCERRFMPHAIDHGRYFRIEGAVAQMVERSLSMREVAGSIPASSILRPFLMTTNDLK